MPQKPPALGKTSGLNVSEISSAKTVISIFRSSLLRPAAFRSISSIFRNFFFLQYKAALLPPFIRRGRYPVSEVDHPLDQKIPFRPDKVNVYLDFIHFFIRVQGLLIQACGKGILPEVRDFIKSLGEIYAAASGVYAKNFSTTKRPRYLARFRFIVIHLFDPHLMCIPSLHVMVQILIHTRYKKIMNMNEQPVLTDQLETIRGRALEITEAVLYVKQHSVNCISAAMYAMTRYDDAFTPEEAETFTLDLFKNAEDISKEDVREIRDHILNLYRQFLDQGRDRPWEQPLLDFLAKMPGA